MVHELSTRWLEHVQHHSCNATGICKGVDASALPKILRVPLPTGQKMADTTDRSGTPFSADNGKGFKI